MEVIDRVIFVRMKAEDLKQLILLGEGYQAEFKEKVPAKVRELTEEICAFANSAGGMLLFRCIGIWFISTHESG